MTSNGTPCPACGALSRDPAWCDQCGAELDDPSRRDWLAPGQSLRVRMLPFELLDPPPDVSTATTDPSLTPLPLSADSSTAPMPALGIPLGASSPHDTMVGDAPFDLLELRITEILHDQPRRRILAALSDDGRRWRVEQFPDSRDDEDSTSAVLPHIVDMPVAFTVVRGHAVRVHRHIECTPLGQRLDELPHLSPRDALRLLDPLLATVERLHAAGYLCLRLSPWSVAYRPDGSIFLPSIPGLYPRQRRAWSVAAVTGYTAPDVYLASEDHPPDERSDVFSLGAILYYMIARRDPPVDERTAHVPFIPARTFDFDASVDLDGLARACLHPSPDRRPACVAELRRCLERTVQRAELRLAHTPPLAASVAAETHVGIAKRTQSPVNQDAVLALVSGDHRTALLAVADGVSTASVGSGDLASRLAMDTVRLAWPELRDAPPDEHTERLRALVERANDAIIHHVNDHLAHEGASWHDVMGSTLTLALVHDGVVSLASVGDSRAWLVGPDHLTQLTRDHNLATLAVADGVRADVALSHPGADALARCLGNYETDPDGHLLPLAPEPDVQRFRLLDNERILLATDGLYNYAAREEHEALDRIAEIVRDCSQPEHAAIELVTLANRGGGGDNIGVALLAVSPEPLHVARWFRDRRSLDDDADWTTGAYPAIRGPAPGNLSPDTDPSDGGPSGS